MVLQYDFKKNNLNYIFFLNKQSFKNLENVVNFFYNSKTRLGLIILVEKNSLEINKLDFLKNLTILFYLKKKRFGIFGLPYCSLQTIFKGFDYTRFNNTLIKSNSFFDNLLGLNYNSVQILEYCKDCFKFNSCFGLGNNKINFNLNKKLIRTKKDLAFKIKNEIKLKNKFSNEFFKKLIAHCEKTSLEETWRAITYARVFTKSKEVFNYDERIIYFCNYLSLKELEKEKEFLLENSKNIEFINYLFELYPKKLKKYVYSKAYNENRIRESFYLYFINEAKEFELKYLNIDFKLEFDFDFLNLRSVGYDFIDNKLRGVKLYADSLEDDKFLEFIKNSFNFQFPERMLPIIYRLLFVKRYNTKGKLISFKIEVYTKNIKKLRNIIKEEYSLEIKKMNNNLEDYIFAFDIDLKGKLKKITVYSK